MLSFPFNKLGILFVAGDLAELNLDRPSGDYTLAFRQELFTDDTLQQGALAWIDQRVPVDCEPTTAIMGRSMSKLTSDLRMISCVRVDEPVSLK